jgi:sugar/nucleoside kinase (ribokinase family)
LLTVVGDDPDGRDLLAECGRMGLLTEHVVVAGDLPTDRYMAIEAAGGLDRGHRGRAFAGTGGRAHPRAA